MTGLCLPGSDIDFVIRFSDKGDEKKSEDDVLDENDVARRDPLHHFSEAVRDEFGVRSKLEEDDEDENDDDGDASGDGGGEHLSYLEVIAHTRVPLVKFTVAPRGVDVDVCFDQPHGPESASLMHRFMESMPPLRPLTFVLKHFLASRDVNKPFTGGIGSYLLQLMIVSFLQHRAREDVARGWGARGTHYNLGALLLDFFELYGVDFNYVTTGASVRHDGFYFGKGEPSKKEIFWNPSKLCSMGMENPLDPTADVGAGAFRMGMIKRIFEHAFRTLLAHVSEPLEPCKSILATIIPPTEEMERRAERKKRARASADDGAAASTAQGEASKAGGGGSASGGGDGSPRRRGKSSKNGRKNDRRDRGRGDLPGWRIKEEEKKKRRREVKDARRHGHDGGGSGGGKSGKNKRRKKERHSR